ncbi:MAG: hypothetical protein AB1485_03850 [Candidatus Thermoplasmatota archaeon]
MIGYTIWNRETFDPVSLALTLLVAFVVLSAMILGLLHSSKRTILRIYENGFVPFRVPLKYLRKKKEFFIPWDEIAQIKYFQWRGFSKLHKSYWILTKSGSGIAIADGHFEEKDVEKIFEKLKKVEEEIKRRGEIPTEIKPWYWPFYDTGG